MRSFLGGQAVLSLLQTMTEAQNLRLGKSVHAQLIISHCCNVIESNYLISFYAKCANLCFARKVFDLMPSRNIFSISILMAGYLHNGYPLEVLSLFRMMGSCQMKPPPNEYIFATVLSSCSELQALREGRQCHAFMFKSGFMLHSYVGNTLIHMYSTCSCIEDAFRVFKCIPAVEIFSLNSMISGFVEHGQFLDAVNVLSSIVCEISRWDHVTYAVVLGLCSDTRDLRLGHQVHCHISKRGFMNNVFVVNTLVDMYGKVGNLLAAWFAFDCLTNRDVISWTALLDACTQNGCFEESLKLFVEMQIDGVQPNEFTYSVVLYSCAGLSDRTNGNALTAHVEKLGYMSHLMVGNALINMHTKSGCIDDAWRIFAALPLKNAISFNSMIIGFSHHGHGKEALKIFHSMMAEKVVPTYVTFIGVLLACGHLHLVDEGYYFVDHLMKSLGIEAGVEHHTCMVGLLCRAGLLDDAYNYLRTIDTEWDVVAWRTLLSACQFYKKFELGEKVADQIVNLYPRDIGTYVLLSNMFAKSNMWAGVMKIRKFMREQRIKKEPGVSWIHVRNEVHVFASEDDKHPLKAHIYGKLTELIKEIRAIGYVPNLASVLHDVEDEQKEEYLSFHSEKLAIAFGLISTPSEAPIYVMKNLRMCNDCHSAVKLISSVARKKIVVRDANRFHCFQNGLCSCGEYW